MDFLHFQDPRHVKKKRRRREEIARKGHKSIDLR
jgi:hypothetical protein